MTATVVSILLVAGSVVALTVFRHRPTPGRQEAQGGTVPPTSALPALDRYPAIAVSSVSELVQNGNQPDDDISGLPNVIGNQPGTYWMSAKYKGPDFGHYGGLGIVLRLSGSHVLHELVVTTPMVGWSGEAFVSRNDASAVSGWGRPTGELLRVNGDQRLSLGDRQGSWALFWMLDPGPSEQAVVDKLSVH